MKKTILLGLLLSFMQSSVMAMLNSLNLAGEYDPATPPVLGEILKQDLSQSHFFSLPGVGHVVSRDKCGLNIGVDLVKLFDS